ncbi:MAG: hypothetical protein IKA02_04185 [Clostridia bacterium]|nr:hypothetical protein [Clostridia bacterium]
MKMQNENYRAINKYIERRYGFEKLSIEEYISLRDELSQPEMINRVIAENEKIEKFSALIRKRIDLSKITLEDFDKIIAEICDAQTENEISAIMSKFNIN